MSLGLITRLLLCAGIAVHGSSILARDFCSGFNTKLIGDFKVYEVTESNDYIVATTPLPGNGDVLKSNPKMHSEIDRFAKKAITKFVFPDAKEVTYTLAGLQTKVVSCPSGKVVMFMQPRAGIGTATVVDEIESKPTGPSALDLFDATKSFQPEKMNSPAGNSQQSRNLHNGRI